MRNGGNVLVCVDTAGRILELAHLLVSFLKPYVLVINIFKNSIICERSFYQLLGEMSALSQLSDKLKANKYYPCKFRSEMYLSIMKVNFEPKIEHFSFL